MLRAIFSSSPKRARIDFAETFATLDGLFYDCNLRAGSMTSELAIARGHLGITMATKSFEGERVARAVVTHITAGPLFAGLSVVAHPAADVDAPLLLVDVRVAPLGVTSAFFDACGSSSSEFDALFRKPLSQTLDAAVASAVRRKRVAPWLDRVSAGAGARLTASAGRGHVIAYALVRYTERWLDGIARASRGGAGDPVAGRRVVANTFRTNGRTAKMIARAFGADCAARYDALLWDV